MKIVKTILLASFLVVTGSLIYTLVKGDFGEEGRRMWRMPWGRMTLLDAYVGLALFAGWILYREKSLLQAIVWSVAVVGLGHPVSTLYALIAMQRSDGDWRRFWLGHRA